MKLPLNKKDFKSIPKEWQNSGTNLVYFGDFHYRPKAPVTRKDDFEKTELSKAVQIQELAKKYHAKALLQPGDFLDKPKADEAFLNKIMEIWGFPEIREARNKFDSGEITKEEFADISLSYIPMIGLIGNHELYGGSLKTYPRTSLSFLERSGFLNVVSKENPYIIKTKSGKTIAISGTSYDIDLLKHTGTDISKYELQQKNGDVDIFMVHEALFDTDLGEGMNWLPVSKIWDKTKADITIAGHIHTGFQWINHKGKLFGNPGAPAQQNSNENELEKIVTATLIHIDDAGNIDVRDYPLDLPASIDLFDTTIKERSHEIESQMQDVKNIIDDVGDYGDTNASGIIEKIANDSDIEKEAKELAVQKTEEAMSEMGANEPLNPNIDYSIKKIILHNFESHSHTEIDLTSDKTPTVLIGESSQGKSSVLRAIYWVLENEGDSKRFVRRHDNITDAYVEIIRNDGLSVKREVEIKVVPRSGNLKIVKNGYVITDVNGNVSETNTEGLSEIQHLFGMNYLQIDNKDKIPLNFMKQEDGWYFIGLKAPQRAKVIGALYGTQYILSAIKNLEATRRSLESRRKTSLLESERITEELKPLQHIEQKSEALDSLFSKYDTLSRKNSVFEKGLKLFNAYQKNIIEYNKAQKIVLEKDNLNNYVYNNLNLYKDNKAKYLLGVKNLKAITNSHELIKKSQKLIDHEKEISILKTMAEKSLASKKRYIDSLSYLKIIVKSKNNFKTANKILKYEKPIQSSKLDVSKIEENYSKIKTVGDWHDKYRTYSLKYLSAMKDLKRFEQELTELKKEYNQSIKSTKAIKKIGSINIDFYSINNCIDEINYYYGDNMTDKTKELTERIEAIEQKISKAKTTMEVSKIQGAEAADNLKDLGIDPKNAEEELEILKNETAELYDTIESKLSTIEQQVEVEEQ